MPNPCLDLTCEFICLLNPSGATCACPEGKSLMNGTCIDQSLLGRYWNLQENQKINSWSVLGHCKRPGWLWVQSFVILFNTHITYLKLKGKVKKQNLWWRKKTTSPANVHQNEKWAISLTDTRWYLKVSGYKYWPKALRCFGSQIKSESFRRKKPLQQWWKGSESNIANNSDFEVTVKERNKPAVFLSKTISSGNLYND